MCIVNKPTEDIKVDVILKDEDIWASFSLRHLNVCRLMIYWKQIG